MELRLGAMRREDGPTFWTRLVRQILSRVRVVPFDEPAAEQAGDILAGLERVGQPSVSRTLRSPRQPWRSA